MLAPNSVCPSEGADAGEKAVQAALRRLAELIDELIQIISAGPSGHTLYS
jgi:hypothetical protein